LTANDRFKNTLGFKKPEGRLPMLEWAFWWDKTYRRWQDDGLPSDVGIDGLQDYFGLDHLVCVAVKNFSDGFPRAKYHGGPVITGEESYAEVRKLLFSADSIGKTVGELKKIKDRHAAGEISVWLWLDGFFWFPRSLFGIEGHLLSFYDHPGLLGRINGELASHYERALEAVYEVLVPDMVGFAEDMSYNHGPMLSRAAFDEFLLPYYRRIIPILKSNGSKVFIDSDGDVTQMIPWLLEAGADGIFPLERQAGVDVVKIREAYPNLLVMGAFDKMTMIRGEEAMRAEFERLFPVMRQGGFIPACDHQTPPEVSLSNYKIYIRLLGEYCARAVE